MAYVDLGPLYNFSLAAGQAMTQSYVAEGNEFQPGQWFRAAISLASDNSPGATVAYGDSGSWPSVHGEKVVMGDNGAIELHVTIECVGSERVTGTLMWLSAPELGE